jgi:hypothetical protein
MSPEVIKALAVVLDAGYGDVLIKIQDGKVVMVEHTIKTKVV